MKVKNGLLIYPFAWRPGSDDIGLTVGTPIGSPNTHGEIDLWSPTAGLRTIYEFTDGNSPPGPCGAIPR